MALFMSILEHVYHNYFSLSEKPRAAFVIFFLGKAPKV